MDIGKALTFITEDERYLEKLGIGVALLLISGIASVAFVGVLGCMAERLKDQLMEKEKLVDIVVGPDSYRDLPNLLATAESGQKAVNVLLSREETYADNVGTKNEKHVAAIESDAGGFLPLGFGLNMPKDKKAKIKKWAPLFLNYGIYNFSGDSTGQVARIFEEVTLVKKGVVETGAEELGGGMWSSHLEASGEHAGRYPYCL